MTRKVTIIGAGNVGASIAFALVVEGIAGEVVLTDINMERAEGEAMDIRQGTPFTPPGKIYAGTYEDAADSDVVIITSGVPRKPGQSRLDLTQTNIDMLKEVAPKIVSHAPDALYIIVTNPVDILTYAFIHITGLPAHRVMGTGTLLDSARLRTRLSEFFSVNQQNIHAYVMGEHGDTSFIPWSVAQIGGIRLNDYKNRFNYAYLSERELDKRKVYRHIRTSGSKIIERKGSTNYAIALTTSHIVGSLFSSVNSVLTVSSMMFGEYGLQNVCLSVPFIVGAEGVCGQAVLDLTYDELEQLEHSARTLKGILKDIKL